MKPFLGVLKEPIEITTKTYSLLTDTPENRAAVHKHNSKEYMRALRKQMEKLDTLCKHYEIDIEKDFDTKMMSLVFRLSEDFVPGFRIKDLRTDIKRGRPNQWDVIKYCELLADVELLKSEKNFSDSEACRVLTSSSRFKKRWGNFNKANLKNRLAMARDVDKNFLLEIGNTLEEKTQFSKADFLKILIDCFGVTKIKF